MSWGSSLTEEEKKWQQNFERKLNEVKDIKSYSTSFLDPRQLELAEEVLKKKGELSYTVYGGCPDAERNAVQVFPAQHKGTLPPVTAVLVEWADTRAKIGHRDLLGAVLALGLRRDQIGDIIMLQEGGAALMVMQSKADFICVNLFQAGNLTVKCSIVDPEQLSLAEDNARVIKGTVASLRVDSLLSLGFGLSRSRVVRMIKGGLVIVNWHPVDSPSLQLKEGDHVTLRGRGRLQLCSVEGETRKGRIRLQLKKYS